MKSTLWLSLKFFVLPLEFGSRVDITGSKWADGEAENVRSTKQTWRFH